jgi:predicted phage tail protein
LRSGYTANVDASQLFLSLFISTIGIVYFQIGRKRSSVQFMLCGIALMGFSYFMGSLWLSLLIGAILTIIPLYFR